jgi:hypothetical protein
MSVLVDWNCPASQDNNARYFEQRDDVLTKILVVISKPKNGMFTWLRIFKSKSDKKWNVLLFQS